MSANTRPVLVGMELAAKIAGLSYGSFRIYKVKAENGKLPSEYLPPRELTHRGRAYYDPVAIRKWADGRTVRQDYVQAQAQRRDAAIIALRRCGMTYQEIGDLFSLTKERVRQVLKIAGMVGTRKSQESKL